MEQMKVLLEAKNLSKVYRIKKGNEVKALDNINLKLPEKGMVFILGKSGSGKSTLLNILGGLDNYTSGDILVKGESTKVFKQKHFDSYRNTYVGFIFQEYNIIEDFNIAQNIALSIELQGRKATNEEVNAILKEVDLEEYGSRKFNELSGGQLQRVAIARALVKKPEIIMADEPTGALDSNTSKQIFDLLKELSKDHLVLIVSHDREYSEMYADRIIELKDGVIISDEEKTDGDTDDIDPEFAVDDDRITYDNGTITIKQGYTLTEEDFKLINEYLKDNNVVLRKRDSVRTHRVNGTFVNTDTSNLVENTDGFKLIKSKLRMKHAFKLGASSFKHKKFKLIISIILGVMSFSMFGVAIGAANYNYVKTAVNSLEQYELNYATFVKKDYTYNDSGSITEIRNDDIVALREKTGINVYGVYHSNLYLRNSITNAYDIPYNSIYQSDFTGFTVVNQSVINEMGLSQSNIVGTLPTNPNEIGISNLTYLTFKEYGFTQTYDSSFSGTPEKYIINSENDLIGKTIVNGEKTYTITCVVDTGLDLTEYKSALEMINNSSNMSTMELIKYLYSKDAFDNAVKYSYVNLYYLSEDGFKQELLDMSTSESEAIYRFALGGLKKSRSTYYNLVSLSEDKSNAYRYFLQNHITDQLNNLKREMDSLKEVFFYIGLFFVVIAGLTLSNYIATSVSYKKKDIGILRAIGSRSSDVFKIFMAESFIISVINWVLSSAVAFTISRVLNNDLRANTPLLIQLFPFGLFEIIAIFVISVAISALATFLPVSKFARKKPIDAIKNR